MIKGRPSAITSSIMPHGVSTPGTVTITCGANTATATVKLTEDRSRLTAVVVPPVSGMYRVDWSAKLDGSDFATSDYAAATFIDVEYTALGIKSQEDGTYDPQLVSAAVFIVLGGLVNDLNTRLNPFTTADYEAFSFTDGIMFDNGLAHLVAAYCSIFLQTTTSTGEIAQTGVTMDTVKYFRKFAQHDITEYDALLARGMQLIQQVSGLSQANSWVDGFKTFQASGPRRMAREALNRTSCPMYSVWRDDKMEYDYRGVVSEFDRWANWW